MSKNKQKVAIGMSGGVDSSVAGALLKKQGYEVIGIFMHFWSDPHTSDKQAGNNKCCSVEAKSDARRVAEKLDIPLYTLNLDQDFKKYIVDNFLEQYKFGLTPNPCVRCNQFIKFGLFWQKAKALGCDYIATGHYAQVKKDRKGWHLMEGLDKAKDQSYFLYNLNQKTLNHCLFPVGKYKKPQIRKIAEKLGLPVFAKKDSQEICFVPDKDHYSFLQRYLKPKSGDIITDTGQIIGQHNGLPMYTLGQRKGIELSGGPWYVIGLNFKTNQLVVTNKKEHPALFNDIMYLSEVNWLQKVKLPLTAEVRIRYMHKNQIGVISQIKKDLYQVKFKTKQRAITPGQSAVIYKNGEVLGGGVIMRTKSN